MTDVTLMGENTPSTAPAPAAAAAAPVVAPAPAADGTAPAAAATEQAAPATTPADAPADKAADASVDKAPEAPKAPEKYEFKAPDGHELNADVMTQFEGVAKELGLSQEAAQKVVDAMGPQIAAAQTKQLEAIKTAWTESARTDKEFGGEKLQENLSVAKKALDAFGTPELRTLLEQTGLGNNPEIIRAFYRAGQKISAPNFVPGGASGIPATSAAATLYPNQK